MKDKHTPCSSILDNGFFLLVPTKMEVFTATFVLHDLICGSFFYLYTNLHKRLNERRSGEGGSLDVYCPYDRKTLNAVINLFGGG